MQVFLYEYFTAGGCWADAWSETDRDAILPEALGMWRAVARDLRRAGISVRGLVDARLSATQRAWLGRRDDLVELTVTDDPRRERVAVSRLASAADWTVLIAPENGGALQRLAERVVRCGGRLASPDAGFIALATDKTRLCEHLTARGVPTPRAAAADAAPSPANPLVVKRRDGCGSQGLRICRDAIQWEAARRQWPPEQCRLEHFAAGAAVGVAALGDGRQWRLLPPLRQLLDEGLGYLGGANDLEPDLRRRATEAAGRALRACPPSVGYVGVDLILGAAPAEDLVLEINPRITSSYVGLSRLCCDNLAGAMLRLAAGEEAELGFSEQPLRFHLESFRD